METEEALQALCDYLRQLRIVSAYRDDQDLGGYTNEHGEWTPEKSRAALTAREWARELLKAAEVCDSGGCPLCQS